MECDLLGLHLAILYIYLVAAQHNWDVFTDPAADRQQVMQVVIVILPLPLPQPSSILPIATISSLSDQRVALANVSRWYVTENMPCHLT